MKSRRLLYKRTASLTFSRRTDLEGVKRLLRELSIVSKVRIGIIRFLHTNVTADFANGKLNMKLYFLKLKQRDVKLCFLGHVKQNVLVVSLGSVVSSSGIYLCNILIMTLFALNFKQNLNDNRIESGLMD